MNYVRNSFKRLITTILKSPEPKPELTGPWRVYEKEPGRFVLQKKISDRDEYFDTFTHTEADKEFQIRVCRKLNKDDEAKRNHVPKVVYP